MTTETNELPTVAELQMEDKEFYERRKQDAETKYLQLVNNPCPAKWLKDLKVSVGKVIKYLPIDKVEFLLTRVFGAGWKREVLREQVMLNSVAVTVRLHYKIPATNTWLFHDGTGAASIQVESGQPASNLSAIRSNAIQLAFPSAASYALSNAAEKLGDYFGRGLNKDSLPYAGSYDPYQDEQPKASNGKVTYSDPPHAANTQSYEQPSKISRGYTPTSETQEFTEQF